MTWKPDMLVYTAAVRANLEILAINYDNPV